jgi:hypothetical protein
MTLPKELSQKPLADQSSAVANPTAAENHPQGGLTLKEDNKLCIECSLPIPRSAKKCTECDTYQDWRRYLPFSTTILSLTIALFSVLGLSIPSIIEAMKDRDAKINAAIISNRMGFLQYGGVARRSLIVDLFVTNSGKLPGAIKGVGVKFRGEKDWDYNSVLFDKDQEGKQVTIAWTSAILEPVRSRIIEVSHPTTVSDDLAGKFQLQIQYFRFDSRIQKFETATY